MAKKGYKYTDEEKLIKRVNQRLVRLERAGLDSYAKRTLEKRLRDLNAWTGKGRARSSVREFSDFEKRKFIKALQIFDKAESSRVKEAKRIEREFTEFYRKLGKEKELNRFFKEKGKKGKFKTAYGISQLSALEDANWFFRNFDPSDLYDFIKEAKQSNWDYYTFAEKFMANFMTSQDMDLKGDLYAFYQEVMHYGD